MFGKLLDFTQKGQIITLSYEKRNAYLHILTDNIINVFVPYNTEDHRSKAIEGDKEQPVSFTVRKCEENTAASTDPGAGVPVYGY